MGSAFLLTDPANLDIRLAVATTSWPSAYRAELFAVYLTLLVVPHSCVINLYSDCASIIAHYEQINNGAFNNVRNIFKQPHHSLWLSILKIIQDKRLSIIWHKVPSHSNDTHNNSVDCLARFAAQNQTVLVDSNIVENSSFYLPLWNSKLINVHYRHFIRSLTHLHGLDSWTNLNRFSSYPANAIDWELTGSSLQPSSPGTSFSASRLKRNSLVLLLEDLPTLTKLQLHKPHVYDQDWICC